MRKKPLLWAASALLILGSCAGRAPLHAQSTESGPASFVDPLIGTAHEGNTFPGAVLPFGMLSWSPEELSPTEKRGSPPGGYAYSARDVRGFSLTHLSGAGCAASGDILFMPLTRIVAESPALDEQDPAYLSELSHAREHATAGYYSVRLQNDVLAELTATLRSGAGRFTYPAGQTATMLIRSAENEVNSSDSTVAIDAEHGVVSGSLTSGDFCGHCAPPGNASYYTIYFAAHFNHAFKAYGTWKDAAVTANSTSADGGTSLGAAQTSSEPAMGKGSGAYVVFDSGAVIGVRVGISYVSAANAEANLQAEDPEGTTFESIRSRAYAAWNAALDRIAVQGGTRQQKTIFYTALYHSLLHMNLASDVNGQYRGMDQKTHRVAKPQAAQYANFSGWDVYRSQVQLVTLLYPEIASDMAQSLLNQADQWGCWDRWTHESGATNVMNGDPSAAAIADIVAFAGDSFEQRRAYQSLLDSATSPHEGHRCSRPRLEQWLTQHYMTVGVGRHDTSVADTLEFSTADFALSQLATMMGDEPNAETLLRRAQYWKNLFNPNATPQEGYLQARAADGSWKSFDPAGGDGFVEGTGAQYVWMVPFNVRGLFDAMGGDGQAVQRLDGFFHDAQGHWAFTGRTLHAGLDNEPSLETPWLYDFAGRPYKTQQTVRAILDTLWKAEPDGIPGNDDLGEMSSWYVWAALGMYPEIPGRGDMVLAAPLFAKATIARARGNIRILAQPQGMYVQSLSVDRQAWPRPWLPAAFLQKGGVLRYVLGDKPNRSWGAAAVDTPPSFDVH